MAWPLSHRTRARHPRHTGAAASAPDAHWLWRSRLAPARVASGKLAEIGKRGRDIGFGGIDLEPCQRRGASSPGGASAGRMRTSLPALASSRSKKLPCGACAPEIFSMAAARAQFPASLRRRNAGRGEQRKRYQHIIIGAQRLGLREFGGKDAPLSTASRNAAALRLAAPRYRRSRSWRCLVRGLGGLLQRA